MGRGGFPPSETGSFSAHHTAQRVGFFYLLAALRQLRTERRTRTFGLAIPI
jgi:hypothetical protein